MWTFLVDDGDCTRLADVELLAEHRTVGYHLLVIVPLLPTLLPAIHLNSSHNKHVVGQSLSRPPNSHNKEIFAHTLVETHSGAGLIAIFIYTLHCEVQQDLEQCWVEGSNGGVCLE